MATLWYPTIKFVVPLKYGANLDMGFLMGFNKSAIYGIARCFLWAFGGLSGLSTFYRG